MINKNKKFGFILVILCFLGTLLIIDPLKDGFKQVFKPEEPFIKLLTSIKSQTSLLFLQNRSGNLKKKYYIFLKSFNDDVKARRLVNLLRAHGFAADIKSIENDKRRIFDVFVGDFNKLDEARVNAGRIQLELGYWTVIRSYDD
jgi:hypothetical protein